MGNSENTECQYCWDTKWMLEWNVPEEDDQGKACYGHYLIIFLELQDAGRKPIQYDSVKIRLAGTSKVLDLGERMRMTFGGGEALQADRVENLISKAVIQAKLKYAGYQYSFKASRDPED